MKNKFIYAVILIILSYSSYAGGLTNGLNLTFKDKLFVYAAAGISQLDVDESLAPNTVLTSGALDNTGSIFEVGLGHRYNKKIFTTFSLQRNKLENANIHNIYGSVNYQLSTKKVKPFIGLLAGHSRLKWSTPPHQVRINKNLTSKGFMYGVQMGIEKKLQNNLSVFIKYQFIKNDHKIEIVDNKSNIRHNSEQNLLLGLQYSF